MENSKAMNRNVTILRYIVLNPTIIILKVVDALRSYRIKLYYI